MTTEADDRYNLQRYIAAQDAHSEFDEACNELRRGRKSGHWIWFIFPQIKGLGTSSTSMYYAISSLDEAKAYLSHPLLARRLREATDILIQSNYPSIEGVFGSLDAMKVKSSMTLFSQADANDSRFATVLQMYFDGQMDEGTISRL